MNSASEADNPPSRGQWLRQQRQSRGWSVPEMRRHLREAAKEAGDTLPNNECLGVMIRRWEKAEGGVSERYRMHYCRAFKLPFEQFGSAPISLPPTTPGGSSASPAQATSAKPASPRANPSALSNNDSCSSRHDSHLQSRDGSSESADSHRPSPGGPSLAEQVALTAHQGNEHAQQTERRDIGETSLEYLRSEITRLSREYMTAEPLPLFFEMRRVREQLYLALARKIWPRDKVELCFLLGCLSSLMANAAEDIGNPSASEELARAGLTYALAIDHRPLTAQLRLDLAAIALWADQPRRCLDLARSGLDHLATGQNAAQLHLMIARAAGRLGDSKTAIAKVSVANQFQDSDYTDDLIQVGGQFSLSRACYHYLAGTAVDELTEAESEAISHLDQSIQLYTAGPGIGEDHSEPCTMVARIDLATAWLRAGDLDAAITAAGPALALPPGRRTSKLPKRISRLRKELAVPRYRSTPEASDLDKQIEQFCRDTIAAQLHQAANLH